MDTLKVTPRPADDAPRWPFGEGRGLMQFQRAELRPAPRPYRRRPDGGKRCSAMDTGHARVGAGATAA
jgi:hypothetical protein